MQKIKRVQFWDIARGIAIIGMLIGHTVEKDLFIYRLIYSFHMPLFVIASGYFFKENEPFLDTVKNVFIKLLLPTILGWTLIQLIFYETFQVSVPWYLKLQVIFFNY